MTLWQLQVFQAIVEGGSLQAAASQLHRTPPALSMSLGKLEEELGFALFTREGYRLTLSPHGRQFMRYSYELLRQHTRLVSLTEQIRSPSEAQLEIAFDTTCNPDLLTPALLQVQQAFATTECMVSGYSQLNALNVVRDNQASLALTPWLAVFQQKADFESLYVADFELTAVITQALLPEDGRISRAALSELPYVMPQQMGMGIDAAQIYRMGGGSKTLVNDVHTLISFVRSGLGWGVVPRQLVADDVASGRLLELNIPGFLDRIRAEVRLVKLAGTVLGPAGEMIWNHFRQFDNLRAGAP